MELIAYYVTSENRSYRSAGRSKFFAYILSKCTYFKYFSQKKNNTVSVTFVFLNFSSRLSCGMSSPARLLHVIHSPSPPTIHPLPYYLSTTSSTNYSCYTLLQKVMCCAYAIALMYVYMLSYVHCVDFFSSFSQDLFFFFAFASYSATTAADILTCT